MTRKTPLVNAARETAAACGMNSFAPLTIHRSQWPSALQAELREALTARVLNPKFHYDSPKQVCRWLALHEAVSPARRDPAVLAVYRAAFEAVVRAARAAPLHLIGLGVGGGQKEAQLIQQLLQAGVPLHYSPTDSSVGMAIVAREAARAHLPSEAISPLVADVATAEDLHEFFDRQSLADARRLVTCFGLIPNLSPEVVQARLPRLLRPGDELLLSANLVPGPDCRRALERILPQYDNAPTRAWLLTLLHDLGLEPGDGELGFQLVQPADETEPWRIEANFTFARPRALVVDGAPVAFVPGERLLVFFSYRYTGERLRALLRPLGLRDKGLWTAPSGEEGVVWLQRD